ncbi:MAG: hypothetical protein M3P23_01170, partial [Actinomycetota bacterium]|nr:hypothetical protein [Actinomycetota bacterium]
MTIDARLPMTRTTRRLVAIGVGVLAVSSATGPAAAAGPVTTRASVSGTGAQGHGSSAAAAISADGRFVAFASAASNLVPGDTNDAADIFVRDRQSGSTS